VAALLSILGGEFFEGGLHDVDTLSTGVRRLVGHRKVRAGQLGQVDNA
jgi:hypothetical protein